MNLRIALVGNPNSGKTTLFNHLTGSAQYVGNWPGVTVEKKGGRLKGHKDVEIQDLPGIYSLSPYTPEELVARRYLLEEQPDLILNVIDGTNLERNLYLSTQLMELNIPVVLAVNMMDTLEKRGQSLDLAMLQSQLGCPVLGISALRGKGMTELINELLKAKSLPPHALPFAPRVEETLKAIEEIISPNTGEGSRRWYAVKLLEREEGAAQQLGLTQQTAQEVEALAIRLEQDMDDDGESIITCDRYERIEKIAPKVIKGKGEKGKLTVSDKIDRVVTNRILALPIFMAVMFLVYYISITTVGTMLTDFTNGTVFGEGLIPMAHSFFEGMNLAPWLTGLLVDGILGGVGAVLGFVPQMLVLFLMLSLLEDCGYMARVAFIMDRIFRRFGLSGKSFIPMLIGSGCSIPGIMASRTIEQERDRRMSIMTTSFIPCGAKMPIVGLIAGTLFGGAWWVAPAAYLIGVAAVIISGILLKKLPAFAGEAAPFVMELPSYRLPVAGNILRSTWERGWSFIKRAGTVILLASVLIWFLSGFGFVDGAFTMVEDMDTSLLAIIGGAIAPIFAPLGFGQWQFAVATVMGLVAKEEVVGVFGVLFGVSGDALAMVEEGAYQGLGAIAVHFTAISAVSFLIFNLLCAPCFAAIGAIRREMNNGRWTVFAVSYMCLFAYSMALIVYQLGMLLTGAAFTGWSVIALLVLAALIWLLARKPHKKALTVSHAQA